MNEAYDHYRALEKKLIDMRLDHEGHECPEEESLIEEMISTWWLLSSDEKSIINSEGPKTMISTEIH